jgi:hypothetical protein
MLRELQLDGTVYNKIDIAITRIKSMEDIAINLYGGFTIMISGDKDSTVIWVQLYKRSAQKYLETRARKEPAN